MNTLRMFVFALAVLSTAFLLRAIADYFSPVQPVRATVARGADVPAGARSASDPSSR
jgi:hypothetical protein